MMTPTQEQAFQRHRKFHEALAAKAFAPRPRKVQIREIVEADTSVDVISFGRRQAVMLVSTGIRAVNVVFEGAKIGVSVERIQRVVATKYKLTKEDILHRQRRERSASQPRQVAMYLAKELTDLSYHELGRRFYRDHSTLQWGHKRIRRLILTDAKLAKQINALRNKLIGEVA